MKKAIHIISWITAIALIIGSAFAIIYIQGQKPLLTVMCFSDLHNQQNILVNSSIRGTITDTCKTALEQEKNVDVVLIGGDVTSNTQVAKENVDAVLTNVVNAISPLTKNILWVAGNHDFNAGEKDGYESAQYYDFYMKNNVGKLSKDDSYFEEWNGEKNLLAYHYEIENYDFVCISTAHSTMDGELEDSNYKYTDGAIEWVDKKLSTLDKDRHIFVMGHFPFKDSNSLSTDYKGMLEECGKKFKAVLAKYPNVIYLYGHDHASDSAYIREDTAQRVTEYMSDGNKKGEHSTGATDSFISAFMGSMRYYGNSIDGSVGASNSKVVQSLLIYVYKDRIELQMKNYGIMNGGKEILKPYTIYLDKE